MGIKYDHCFEGRTENDEVSERDPYPISKIQEASK